MAFAKGQLGFLLSLDHRRLDDRQSLGARTAAAQKKKQFIICDRMGQRRVFDSLDRGG